jgi:hypothetical protein
MKPPMSAEAYFFFGFFAPRIDGWIASDPRRYFGPSFLPDFSGSFCFRDSLLVRVCPFAMVVLRGLAVDSATFAPVCGRRRVSLRIGGFGRGKGDPLQPRQSAARHSATAIGVCFRYGRVNKIFNWNRQFFISGGMYWGILK